MENFILYVVVTDILCHALFQLWFKWNAWENNTDLTWLFYSNSFLLCILILNISPFFFSPCKVFIYQNTKKNYWWRSFDFILIDSKNWKLKWLVVSVARCIKQTEPWFTFNYYVETFWNYKNPLFVKRLASFFNCTQLKSIK